MSNALQMFPQELFTATRYTTQIVHLEKGFRTKDLSDREEYAVPQRGMDDVPSNSHRRN